MRFVPLFLFGLLAAPATALAAESGVTGDDRTMDVMLGLIFVLMIALVVIGALEGRKPH
jgi:hypothetical protein